MSSYSYDPELGYVPSIPEPFTEREKRFLWWPASFMCICGLSFKTKARYETHYALNHIPPDTEGADEQ